MTPRWVGLYLLTIAALTLFPFSPPFCGNSSWRVALFPGDILMNVLLFVPFGLAMHRATLARTLAMAFAFSFAIEFSQQWLPRSPDITDLFTNSSGALLGHYLARRWKAHTPGPLMSQETEHFLFRAGAALLVSATLVEAVLGPENDLSNWEPLPVVIGNEPTGNRAWVGELYELSIYDHARDESPHASVERLNGPPPAWKDGGPIFWLDFKGVTHGSLDGPNGATSLQPHISQPPSVADRPSGLSFAPRGIELSPLVGDHLLERLRATGELTLSARLRPHSLQQEGPARILSFGKDDDLNLVLAQYGAGLVANVRTPGTITETDEPQIETPEDVLSGEEQRVSVTYDGYDAKMFVDGACVAEAEVSISTAYPLTGPALGGTIVLCCALAALAAGSFGRTPRGRLARGLPAGAAVWCVLYQLDAWGHVASFDRPAMLLGGLTLAVSVPLLLADRPLTPRGPSQPTTSSPPA